mgnify:CR=1 FL=1
MGNNYRLIVSTSIQAIKDKNPGIVNKDIKVKDKG